MGEHKGKKRTAEGRERERERTEMTTTLSWILEIVLGGFPPPPPFDLRADRNKKLQSLLTLRCYAFYFPLEMEMESNEPVKLPKEKKVKKEKKEKKDKKEKATKEDKVDKNKDKEKSKKEKKEKKEKGEATAAAAAAVKSDSKDKKEKKAKKALKDDENAMDIDTDQKIGT